MRFRRLEVRAYRAIDHAELEFGPGLNVLYGPNDLGKSTLAAAMRAVLLLPAESTAHQVFVPWHDVGPPKVRLTFERDLTVFRVTKIFGNGSLASAQLESSPDGSSFHEEERGRAVDRRLRELLRWGIEAPGGKGAARGLPESFLSQVLLGDQADVPLILDRSLESDRDGSGKERLSEALQALSQDPLFKRVLDAAQTKVDAAFTPTGRRKTGQSSPFALIKEQITLLAQEFERLAQQRRETEEVQQRIGSLTDERLAAEASIGALEARVAEQTKRVERLAARRQASARVDIAEGALKVREGLRVELTRLEGELASLRLRAVAQAQAVAVAAAGRSAATDRSNAAEQAASELSGEAALAQQKSLRAELDSAVRQVQAEGVALERLAQLIAEVAATDVALDSEVRAVAAADASEAKVRETLAAVLAELSELRELEGVLEWRDAELAAERARAALADAQGLEQQAHDWRGRVASARTGPALPDVPSATLIDLRQLEQQIEVAAARLDVGLALVLSVPAGNVLALGVDGGAEQSITATGQPMHERARRRISAHLPGGIELLATAGDAAVRGELDGLERRWTETAVPLLTSCRVDSLDELGACLEAARVRRREALEWLREAEAAEARAREKRELGAELEHHERRLEQRRRALEHSDLHALQERLETLSRASTAVPGALDERRPVSRPAKKTATSPGVERQSLEASIERRRADLEARRTRHESELPALSAARVRASTRASTLEEARDAIRARLRDAWSAHAGVSAVCASLVELEGALAAASRSSVAAVARREAWELARAAELAAVQREREQAVRALAEARERYDASHAAGLATRERLLTLEAQLAERQQRIDPDAERGARLELEQARAELESHGALVEASPEQLATSRDELARARGELERVLVELRRAEGALGHVGGDVVAMRERQTQEALERARALELDQEREYDAYRLLVEQLREAENEQGTHLGRALEAPVSERFERLTEGRYRQVGLDGGLGLQGVAIAGKHRAYAELSEGTQEQLATILRLCIAEYLETSLVLDDHLAQTHRQRAEWFRSTLRESAARIQIVVLTARPEDYLSAEEMCDGAPCKEVPGARVRAIDLERVIRRARYDRVG